MRISKFEPLTTLVIWSPKYSTKEVLLSVGKVKAAKTKYLKIVFTKAPSMEGDWIVDSGSVKRRKKVTNSAIQCYAVPLDLLLPLEIETRDLRAVW